MDPTVSERVAHSAEIDAPRWDDDLNHPEGVDCDGYPLSSGERCGRREHRPYVYPPEGGDRD